MPMIGMMKAFLGLICLGRVKGVVEIEHLKQFREQETFRGQTDRLMSLNDIEYLFRTIFSMSKLSSDWFFT